MSGNPIAEDRFTFEVTYADSQHTVSIPFASGIGRSSNSFFPSRPNQNVQTLLISQHGMGGKALDYLQNGIDAAVAAGVAPQALVVAPQWVDVGQAYSDTSSESYDNLEEVLANEPNLLTWDGGRFFGARSKPRSPDYPARASSYHVLDRLIEDATTSGRFPNIQSVVIVGQSGGGQMVNRYAATSQFPVSRGFQVRYVIMNPGTYLYMGPRRLSSGNSFPYQMTTPTEEMMATAIAASNNPNQTINQLSEQYNRYPFGLEPLNNYWYLSNANLSAEDIRNNYRSRRVAHLIGENDNNPEAASLPRASRAMLQGAHRLQRADVYFQHLCGEQVWGSAHAFRIVPNVGHNGRNTMLSPIGLQCMFGEWPTDSCRSVIRDLDPPELAERGWFNRLLGAAQNLWREGNARLFNRH
ncbi:hypothetical protein [Nodosilinea sp. P-1105]|uniref:hypothetical protein n=1 Tax=Nodosilinea sp. P-1105 TaxID=2546229 RepID=UPI00146BB758|nr:hypothetical protein [Nodosilinea sp. P-1105]NMF84701.1 hypothetical protein [Nodosilinea sp. P-1105]